MRTSYKLLAEDQIRHAQNLKHKAAAALLAALDEER